jgi:hypothetical protein
MARHDAAIAFGRFRRIAGMMSRRDGAAESVVLGRGLRGLRMSLERDGDAQRQQRNDAQRMKKLTHGQNSPKCCGGKKNCSQSTSCYYIIYSPSRTATLPKGPALKFLNH